MDDQGSSRADRICESDAGSDRVVYPCVSGTGFGIDSWGVHAMDCTPAATEGTERTGVEDVEVCDGELIDG